MVVSSLRKAAEILTAVNDERELADECTALADEVAAALQKYAVVEHPEFGKIYAFEVDGFGSAQLMDDANVPSLLAMPYLGDVERTDPIYENTRRFVWSTENPYFWRGAAGEGIGGISSLIQHWRRPERPDAPAPLPADDREDFIRDRRREEPDKREMPLPAPFRPLRPNDDIVTGDFDRMFLQPRSIRARSALYVSSETKRKVLEVVRKVGDEHTTATSYVENILRHHLDH